MGNLNLGSRGNNKILRVLFDRFLRASKNQYYSALIDYLSLCGDVLVDGESACLMLLYEVFICDMTVLSYKINFNIKRFKD